MADENNRPKFPFLKKRVGEARYIKRNVTLNPPTTAAAEDLLPLDKTQTSSQSLPLIDNLSPIPKDQPATNSRPTTAETGDSGVRDVNLHVSPTYDSASASVRTTVTAHHRESPPKSPPPEDEGEKLFQNFQQLDPASARRFEKFILRPNINATSRTESYTSLDRIKTPPIDFQAHPNKSPSNRSASKTPPIRNQRKSPGSDKSSDFSVEIDAASRAKDSASVGTSRVHDASAEAEHEHDATVRPHHDSLNLPTSRLHRTSQPHNFSLPPLQTQDYEQETPLNSKARQPLFKSFSSNSVEFTQRRPLTYLGQTARRLGIHPVPRYVLPPRPRALESPAVVNGLGTPQASSTKIGSFYHTPILPEKFASKEEGKIVESLAEQLRALLILLDVGMDERKQHIDQLKYIYSEKSKALQQKDQEMKTKMKEGDQKIIDAKAKLKLEFDKIKLTDVEKTKFENELNQVKTRYGDTARILSDIRQAKNQMEQKLKKAEQELQKEREKTKKWETLNIRLQKDLEMERMKAQLAAKYKAQQPSAAASQEQQTRQPLRTIPIPGQQNNASRPQAKSQQIVTPPFQLPQQQSLPQFQNQQPRFQFPPFEQPQPQPYQQQPHPSQQQQQPPTQQRRYTNTSTSSVASSTKNVNWASPIAEHRSISGNCENFNFSSLQIYIPEEQELGNTVDNPVFIEHQYPQFGCYRIMKKCQCETLRYFSNGDLQYCCLNGVNVNICYFEENGQLTVTLPGGYVVNSFQSMQLEIIREETKEKTIVKPDGTRYEFYKVPNEENEMIDKILSKDEGKRKNVDGSEELLIDPVTHRSNEDYAEQTNDHVEFICPGFTVTRSLKKDSGGALAIRVNTDDKDKYWKLTVCPEHKVFYVKHYEGNDFNRCTYSEHRCVHLKH